MCVSPFSHLARRLLRRSYAYIYYDIEIQEMTKWRNNVLTHGLNKHVNPLTEIEKVVNEYFIKTLIWEHPYRSLYKLLACIQQSVQVHLLFVIDVNYYIVIIVQVRSLPSIYKVIIKWRKKALFDAILSVTIDSWNSN